MEKPLMKITTASGEVVPFSSNKLIRSLKKSGADKNSIAQILQHIEKDLYPGISTQDIYKKAFDLLQQKDSVLASRYKLKKAIYELGPTGYPFERFVAAIFQHSGYEVHCNKVVQGRCVTHEIDVMAIKENKKLFIECKFHGEQGRFCNVKIPLYIHSRFKDIEEYYKTKHDPEEFFNEGWVVTNTRFSADAQKYGKCVHLHLLGWDTPKGSSLKERIDAIGLYPITVSTLLSEKEKQYLLERDIVLCKDLVREDFLLDHLGISTNRKDRILRELKSLTTNKQSNA